MGFWQNVEKECEYKGISRKELANSANFSVNTISNGLRRNGTPPADLAIRISKALNVPLESLIKDEAKSIDKSNYLENKRLFDDYLPYIKKLNTLPKESRDAILMIIEKM